MRNVDDSSVATILAIQVMEMSNASAVVNAEFEIASRSPVSKINETIELLGWGDWALLSIGSSASFILL